MSHLLYIQSDICLFQYLIGAMFLLAAPLHEIENSRGLVHHFMTTRISPWYNLTYLLSLVSSLSIIGNKILCMGLNKRACFSESPTTHTLVTDRTNCHKTSSETVKSLSSHFPIPHFYSLAGHVDDWKAPEQNTKTSKSPSWLEAQHGISLTRKPIELN